MTYDQQTGDGKYLQTTLAILREAIKKAKTTHGKKTVLKEATTDRSCRPNGKTARNV